jgi:hypothetical protein
LNFPGLWNIDTLKHGQRRLQGTGKDFTERGVVWAASFSFFNREVLFGGTLGQTIFGLSGGAAISEKAGRKARHEAGCGCPGCRKRHELL